MSLKKQYLKSTVFKVLFSQNLYKKQKRPAFNRSFLKNSYANFFIPESGSNIAKGLIRIADLVFLHIFRLKDIR